MSKAKLFLVVFTMCLFLGSFNANAMCPGCTSVVEEKGDDIIVYGSFSARVKWIDVHYGPDGRLFTYSYLTLTGTTMAYCQQQLNAVLASPGVSVVQACQAD